MLYLETREEQEPLADILLLTNVIKNITTTFLQQGYVPMPGVTPDGVKNGSLLILLQPLSPFSHTPLSKPLFAANLCHFLPNLAFLFRQFPDIDQNR